MLKKSKVAIFSDLHLGIYGNSELWHKIAIKWAEWIGEELHKQKVRDILFLGDFFHNRSEISVQTIHVASEILEVLSNFEIYMIIGNHDAYYKNRADVHSLGLLRGHPNLHIIDRPTIIPAFDKELLMVPWNAELLDGEFDYIFGHFEIQNFKMNNFKICDHGLSAKDLLAKSENIFSGHFHHRNKKTYNEGTIHYVGNTFPMDFSDVGNIKGYYTLDVETNELEFFENTVSPKFKKILVSKIKEYKKEDYQNNIIKLVVDMSLTESQVEKVQIFISKFNPFQVHTEYNITTKTIEDVEEIDSIEVMDSITEFIDQMKLEDVKQTEVSKIMKGLYERNK